MASLLRISRRQGLNLALNFCRQRRNAELIRCISTSKKNKDAATVTGPVEAKEPWQIEVEKEVAEDTKDWISFGYSLTDKDEDAWSHHMFMFLGISLCMIGGGFVIAYMPDPYMKDWAQREAYIELARREKEGLTLLDPDLIPRDEIELPSDEELGDRQIII